MSFGEPNNPYGQPPQGQPGYGYPQAPQGVPQQGAYGYPAAPPVAPYGAYPGGAPYGMPMTMPGSVKTARVLLWIMSILQLLAGILVAIGGSVLVNEADGGANSSAADAVTGLFVVLGALIVAFGVWGVVIAARCGKGGTAIRVSGIVYGSLLTAGCLANLGSAEASGRNGAMVGIVLSVLIIVFLSKSDAGAWFKRPRY